MKLYSELSRIETQIHKLKTIHAMVSVLCNGAESSTVEELQSALWFLEESLGNTHDALLQAFEDAWAQDRASCARGGGGDADPGMEGLA